MKQTKAGERRKSIPNIEHEIDESDLYVPPKVLCFVQAEGGLKQFELDLNLGFDLFQFHVSNLLCVPAWELLLTYSTSAMKRGEWWLITEEKEFKHMMDEIKNYFEHQIVAIRGERLKDAAATHNATLKGCLYVPKALKRIPDVTSLCQQVTSVTWRVN
ncbi:hypothetical protein FRC10_001647 [Ceratobasidium sp. 414]|nr:hypothetical protein FRC10_001647 [Ceratobasidium sp. 414]